MQDESDTKKQLEHGDRCKRPLWEVVGNGWMDGWMNYSVVIGLIPSSPSPLQSGVVEKAR